jgi:peptidoglycan LD-endopeptidase LytH
LKTNFLFILFFLVIANPTYSDSISVFEKWNSLDKKIAINNIDKEYAIRLIKKYEEEVVNYFYINNGKEVKRKDWVFPLSNYSKIIFRDNGKDYRDDSYDYFDGNKSWNHPANDIIITDSNKDCLDDSTGKPVDVVSMSSGVVIATDSTWEPGSILRAGKYIRIYDVTNKKFLYYSHLKDVFKKPGDIINIGDKIGEVGRTGRQTILQANITHLHIALLYIDDGYPLPEPLTKDLMRTEKRR